MEIGNNITKNLSDVENMTEISFIVACSLNVPVAIFGTLGNIFTLVMLVRKVIPGTNSLRLKLIYLTIADLAVVVLLMIMMVAQINSYLNPVDGVYILNLVMAYIMNSTVYLPYSISAYVVIFIAIERITAIVKPHKVKTYCTYRLAKIQLSICFAVSIVISVLNAAEFKVVYDPEFSKYVLQLTEVGKQKSLMAFLKIFVFNVYFVIPILTTLVCNIIFVISLLHHRRKMARLVADVNTATSKKKSKTEKMIVLLTIVFFVNVAPSVILRTYIRVADSGVNNGIGIAMTVGQLLFTANHCLNPIVYAVTVPGYRRRLNQLVRCGKKAQEQTSTS